jgi:hypothetical protein
MTTLGWVFMTLSLVMVWGGAFWCYKRVLQTPAEEKVPSGYGP